MRDGADGERTPCSAAVVDVGLVDVEDAADCEESGEEDGGCF